MIKSKLEIGTGNWNWELELGIGTGNWKLEFENGNCNWKLEQDIGIRNWFMTGKYTLWHIKHMFSKHFRRLDIKIGKTCTCIVLLNFNLQPKQTNTVVMIAKIVRRSQIRFSPNFLPQDNIVKIFYWQKYANFNFVIAISFKTLHTR